MKFETPNNTSDSICFGQSKLVEKFRKQNRFVPEISKGMFDLESSNSRHLYSVKFTIIIYDKSKIIVGVYNYNHVRNDSLVYVEIKELAATKVLKFSKVPNKSLSLKIMEKLHDSETQKVSLNFEESEVEEGKF